MYKILKKEILGGATKLIVLEGAHVAAKAKAGQFVIVRTDENGERIPLTIADFDAMAGTVTLIFQEVGKSTMALGKLEVGDSVANLAGPLGHPTEIKNYGSVAILGGGVGIAPVFPIARSLKEAGNHVFSIIGARNKSLLFWEDRMRSVSDELVVCTDDGSYGRKGLITEPLKERLEKNSPKVDRVWAVGPAIMMKFVTLATRPFNVPTIVSLNSVMVDGTGMCGGCRVLMTDGAQFVCVEGPEFDGHKVNWDNLLARQRYYQEEETRATERWKHECKLETVK